MHGAVVSLLAAERMPEGPALERVRLATTMGDIECRFRAAGGDAAVLWVFGADGGFGGPAGGLYSRLGERLQKRGVASLELDYRRPGQLTNCVMDVLTGLRWLEEEGKRRVVLVGHSFGGAVVISAGAVSPSVLAVAALSSQFAGASAVAQLSPRPLLLIHGEADEVLPPACSEELYGCAGQPRQIILYPRCRHGLDECRDELDRDLDSWLGEALGLIT
ncbi:alpha/beta hydrolase [Aestuariivirga sp.]|uniref:alpha/beta hydrolase n=1 Tax=Aestuariivirga sp. TaxID=2650926 RepID=UPI00391CE77D